MKIFPMILSSMLAMVSPAQVLVSNLMAQSLSFQYPLRNTLAYDLTFEVNSLALNASRTWNYYPSLANLGTNQSVWTWPVGISCLGIASDGYQCVLIAPDKALVCAHYGGEAGQTVTYHDTNGLPWTGTVSSVIPVIGDMEIAQFASSAPSSIVIPYVLPPNFTNWLQHQLLTNLPAFWPNKNLGQLQYSLVTLVSNYTVLNNFGTWITLTHNGFGPFGNGSPATGGDSGSPAFMMWSNNLVLLSAVTGFSPNDETGMFVSGQTNWNSLVKAGVTNGFKILDLANYQMLP